MDFKKAAREIFLSGVEAVLPGRLMRQHVEVDGRWLRLGAWRYDLEEIKHIYAVGMGKASAWMAAELELILASRIDDGLVIVKYGHGHHTHKIRIVEASHPVPDDNGVLATKELLKLAEHASDDDLVVCLISGGGSALLVDVPENSNLKEIQELNNILLRSGANIREMNCVRKHLSRVKGGQLAKAVFPARLASLILSDVVNDPLDVIASGPAVPDPSTFAEALRIVEKYDLAHSIPAALLMTLQKGVSGEIPETPKPGDSIFDRTDNTVIGSNRIALEAAARKAGAMGFHALVVNASLEGPTIEVIENICAGLTKNSASRPACLLFGGETTLPITGNGLGGRNQHSALLAAILLNGRKNVTFLAAGSDGTDGPTDAAGAIVDGDSVNQAMAMSIDPVGALQQFDSYNFFKNAGGHIITGPTKTNVMDIICVLLN